MATPPSLEEQLRGIPEEKLNRVCEREHLVDLSASMTEWQTLAPLLGLRMMDEEEIRDCPEVKGRRIKMLSKWKEKFGRATTYRKLVEAFEKAERRDLVNEVCTLLHGEREITAMTFICDNCYKREFAKKAAPECKKMLSEGLAPLRKINADIAEANKQVEAVKTKISIQSASVTNAIRQSFNRLHEILYQREQELLAKTSELVEKKLCTLNAQQKTFQTATAEFLSLSDFVERNLESVTDEELVSLHKPILARLEEEGKKHSQLNLKPAEITTVIPHIPFIDLSELCITEGDGIEASEVGKQTQFVVHLTTKRHTVAAKLESLVDDSAVQCAVCEKEGGVYEVSYTPKTRGRQSLTVTVNGKEIAGSPFQVFVKIHPNPARQARENHHWIREALGNNIQQ